MKMLDRSTKMFGKMDKRSFYIFKTAIWGLTLLAVYLIAKVLFFVEFPLPVKLVMVLIFIICVASLRDLKISYANHNAKDNNTAA